MKLPAGAFEIRRLPVSSLRINEFGAVKVEDGPDLIGYKILFCPKSPLYGPPNRMDLEIPDQEQAALEKTVADMALPRDSPDLVLSGIKKYFLNNFQYSLVQTRTSSKQTPLSDFLLRTRSGHCEFFATAAVLLLRAHGIPARYMAGYMVDEYSDFEGMYVVRARHAHAWALAHVDGVWRNLDVTPPSWLDLESRAVSFWSPFYDFWGWLSFKYSKWRWTGKKKIPAGYLVLPLIPLIIFLVIRLNLRKQTRPGGKQENGRTVLSDRTEMISPFYRIERHLVSRGFIRKPHQTIPDWINYLETSSRDIPVDSLRRLCDWHYRLRFDPKGLDAGERSFFEQQVEEWLTRYRAKQEASSP